MKTGIQFFPDVGPEQRSGRDYWQEALRRVMAEAEAFMRLYGERVLPRLTPGGFR